MPSAASIKGLIDKLVNWTIVFMFTSIFLVVLAQIYYRYILISPLIWSEELSRFIFIWVSLMGWVLATRSGSHIRITFFSDKFPEKARKALMFFFNLCMLGFLAALAWLGVDLSMRTFGRSAVTIPQIPVGMFYAALPVSCLFCMFYVIFDMACPDAAKDAPAVME